MTDEPRPGTARRRGPAAAPGAEPLADLQWDMRMIKATPEGSYKVNPGRKGVTVGIIDTGVDGSHPDIAPNFNASLSRNFTTDIEDIDGACADDPDGSCEDPADVDENGHGTHVAGTIGVTAQRPRHRRRRSQRHAGQPAGRPGLRLLLPRRRPSTRSPTPGDNGIDVVNMSFFIDPWLYNCAANPADSPQEQAEQRTIIEATQRALRFARRHGVTLVAALGNEPHGPRPAHDRHHQPGLPGRHGVARQIDNSCLDHADRGRRRRRRERPRAERKQGRLLELRDRADATSRRPGGYFRDFFGTPHHRRARNMILAPYPFDRRHGRGLRGHRHRATARCRSSIADCTGATADTCTYWQYLQGTSMASATRRRRRRPRRQRSRTAGRRPRRAHPRPG